MKRIKCLIFGLLAVAGIGMVSNTAKATEYSNMVAHAPYIFANSSLDSNGNTVIAWEGGATQTADPAVEVGYEMQLATNQDFKDAKTYLVKDSMLQLNKSVFGSQGGNFYLKVRVVVDYTDETKEDLYSEWSDVCEMTFVKISKKNFPGIYKILLNGSKCNGVNKVEKLIFDKNKDGWLDAKEINELTSFTTLDETKKKKGKSKLIKAPTISNLKGIEYLKKLSTLSLARYSGKTVDLTKNNIDYVWVREITAKQFTLKAPDAKYIHLEAAHNGKTIKMDTSTCKNVVDLSVYGNKKTKTVKLPKNKENLKILSVSNLKIKSLNANSYEKLQQLYVYDCDVKKVQVDKCKDLRYIYFYYCDNIKSLDLKANKKLRGADFYHSPGLTKSTVKKSKSGKYTWNKGKWWYGTAKYKKDMKDLY